MTRLTPLPYTFDIHFRLRFSWLTRLVCWAWLGSCTSSVLNVEGRSIPCFSGTIPNSNVTLSACNGVLGDECFYECDPGFLKRGRHICQSYSAGQQVVLDRRFFGGSCNPLCNGTASRQERDNSQHPPDTHCGAGSFPTRFNSTPDDCPCLSTVCRSEDDTLGNLTRGAYEVFRLARHIRTGLYLDHVDPRFSPENQTNVASSDATGVGIVAECVAAALGYITIDDAASRVLLSLQALSGQVPGCQVPRSKPGGWFPTFFDSDTGEPIPKGQYATDSVGLVAASHLFAAKFFADRAPHLAAVVKIGQLSKSLLESTIWTEPFCNGSQTSSTGTCIPWLLSDDSGCSDCQEPAAADGYYYYSELHWFVWMVYEVGCGAKNASASSTGEACTFPAIEQMWQSWQGRRLHPDYHYANHSLLTLAPSFVTQLPFFLVHPFNSDETYLALLKQQWLAEWSFFNSSRYYAGEKGRYGLGAGPTASWCAGTGYLADDLIDRPNSQACRYFSPYAVAGYSVVAPDIIKQHLLALLASGESVVMVPEWQRGHDQSKATGKRYPILWRKSLLQQDPIISCSWGPVDVPGSCGITPVDFAAEFFGLAIYQLGAEFYQRYTDHF